MSRGTRHGAWTIVEPLGQGSNSKVWRCTDQDGREGAIKLFRRSGKLRLARFRDEISFLMSADADDEGVLPILDSNLAETDGEPWFVMPVATELGQALGPDPELDVVVGAVRDFAATLARLHAQGVGHRDLKPDNLFAHDGRWVIGDFGLVAYPDKDPRTERGRRVGPVDFMAPEMRASADSADPAPADVFSLMKVLWVLATGLSLPQPGPHRADDPAYQLETYVAGSRLPYLDRLMERGTRMRPEDRLRMDDVAAELHAWLDEPRLSDPIPDFSVIRDRLVEFGEVGGRRQKALEELDNQAADLFQTWTSDALVPIHERLKNEIVGASVTTEHSHAIHPFLTETAASGRRRSMFSMATTLRVAGAEEKLHCGIGMQYFENGRAELAASFVIEPQRMGGGLFHRAASSTVGSADAEQAARTLTAGLHDGLVHALGVYQERIGA